MQIGWIERLYGLVQTFRTEICIKAKNPLFNHVKNVGSNVIYKLEK